MFSGIIESLGIVEAFERRGDDARLVVRHGFGDVELALGESICTSGVCLTAVAFPPGSYVADLSAETLRRTTLGSLQAGDTVNLERSLRLGDRLSGHFVFGHVDGVGRVVELRRLGESAELLIEAPAELERYLVLKGSVSVDGVSLTVAALEGGVFTIALIPYTLDVTSLGQRVPGDPVNLEADVIAKYVERLIAPHRAA